MIRLIFKLGTAAAIVLTVGTALAQAQGATCQRLEAQLAALDRGNDDPARADRIFQAEDAVNRQQFEVDRLVARARRMGCGRSGFFSIFTNPPRQCGALNSEIGRQRLTLERLQNRLERLSGNTTERAAQRQSLLIALGNNGCGSQYRSAAVRGQEGGFFDRLFGGGIFQGTRGELGGTFRTVCVRTCDGYYFPISFATTPDRFRDDAEVCQRMCPAAEVSLYTYHNPGEDITRAVSLNGRLYSELPTAFEYRKSLNPACSCRRSGESWYEALKGTGPDITLVPGDFVVDENDARRLSQPRIGPDGKPIPVNPLAKNTAAAQPPAANAEASGGEKHTKRKVRTIGPTFLQRDNQIPTRQ
jgi:hypothetical protein